MTALCLEHDESLMLYSWEILKTVESFSQCKFYLV